MHLVKENANAVQKHRLIAIQLPSQIPCTPHKLLVLMLLHLQLPLSLHTDG